MLQAIDAYEKALELASDMIVIYENLIVAYIAIADYQKAILTAEKGLTVHPCSMFFLTQISTCLMNLTRDGQADVFIDKILKIDPSFTQALFLKGMVLKRRDSVKDAIEMLSAAIRNDPITMKLCSQEPNATVKSIASIGQSMTTKMLLWLRTS
jgi:tetratricopeptide (TPR) repeat protein